MKAKIQTGVYRHYKGHLYFVIGLARHSETEEPFVVYIPLEKRNPKNRLERQRLCIRPFKGPEGFMNAVNLPKYKYKGPRFKLVVPVDFGIIP